MSEFASPLSTKFLPSAATFAESALDLAYNCMLSELIASFLHEFNNPLTVLASSAGLLSDLRAEDEVFAEVVQNLTEGSDDLTRLSNALRAVAKAGAGDGTNDPKQLCEHMLQVSGYRLKRATLSAQLNVEPNIRLQISERRFLLLFYNMLELSLLDREANGSLLQAPAIFTVELGQSANACRLAVHVAQEDKILDWENIESAPVVSLADLPKPMQLASAPFFHFVLEQTVCILQQCGSSMGWQMNDANCRIEAVIPAS